MYGSELLEKGVYGIRDLKTKEIVYVGSTNVGFAIRWSTHFREFNTNQHCNLNLVELFKSGMFEFVILESGDFDSKTLLQKERQYTLLYEAHSKGYVIHIGGGTLQPSQCKRIHRYKVDTNVLEVRKYIEENWFNKKIFKEDREIIINELSKHFNISTKNFMKIIKKLGFIIQRFSDKCSWLITETNY